MFYNHLSILKNWELFFFFFFSPLAKLATKDIYCNTNKIKLKKKRKKEKEKEKERSPNIALTKFSYIYKMGI